MNLSKRLEAVISLVPDGSAVLDVGCDHAYVPIELVLRGISPCAVASDVREGPLRKAGEHIGEAGASGQIAAVLSDGVPDGWTELLAEISGDIRGDVSGVGKRASVTVITAGMGGCLIRDIFRNTSARDQIRYWIASPQRDADIVRRAFTENGFAIEAERFIEEDGKYYPVIRFVQSGRTDTLTDAEARYGPLLIYRRDPVLMEYLKKKYGHLCAIAGGLPPGQEARRAELCAEAEMLKRIWMD